eukprot:TRINITY_DN2655_c0_g1_i1.p1 TRINITY_DN2655_c0_g1~~TRINITY_DN2655_c0_g1_i1.p1  ORF type:complete len:366 (-),score=106.82 TRINITY_DN2655_c0_g1_i1:56-1087(-)
MSGNNNCESKIVTIASRKSKLALIQTNHVKALLEERTNDENIKFHIVTKETLGDQILNKSLSKIGEKGLFTKELEVLLYNELASFAVHSLKDMPTVLPDGLVLGCITERESPFDAVVMNENYKEFTLESLPEGSIVGTSSLRRIAQLKRKYSHLEFKSVRGNLTTRLRKLDEPKEDEPKYACLILAEAGLKRQELSNRIHSVISSDVCLPAVGQGALAIECKENDNETLSLLSTIKCNRTTICCSAERSFMTKLQGGCQTPVAAYAQILNQNNNDDNDILTITGRVLSLDGSECLEHSLQTNIITIDQACLIGQQLAEFLIEKGADRLLVQSHEENNSNSNNN